MIYGGFQQLVALKENQLRDEQTYFKKYDGFMAIMFALMPTESQLFFYRYRRSKVRLNIKMLSFEHMDSRFENKTMV